MSECLEGTVPAGAVAAVAALCYAATAPASAAADGGGGESDASAAVPMPPPLVPMLAYLVGSGISFDAADGLVPHLRCPRPYDRAPSAAARAPKQRRPSGVSSLPSSTAAGWSPSTAWLVDAISLGGGAEDTADSRVTMQRLLAAMPCPTTELGLPRDHRAAAGLRVEAILGVASSVRTGLSSAHPAVRRLAASEATFANASALKRLFFPPPVVDVDDGGARAAKATCSPATPVVFCPDAIETLVIRRPEVAAGSSTATEVLSEVFEQLASENVTLPRLTEVDLSYNDELRDETVCRLVAHPSLQSGLRALRLWLTPITKVAVVAVCDKCTELRVLDLANCLAVGDDALRAIGSASFAAQLVELSLSYTGITDAGLCEAAPRLRSLESVSVRGCKIGDAGVMALVGSACARHLDRLDLSNLESVDGRRGSPAQRGISDETLVAIAEACAQLTWLSVMNSKGLTGTAIHRFMVSRAALRLPMRALNLRSTGADDASLEPLVSEPACVGRLTALELWQCAGVTDLTLDRLAAQLAGVSVACGGRLEDIDVSYTAVTAGGFADFAVAVACAQAGCSELQAAQRPGESTGDYSRRTAGYCGNVRLRNLLSLGCADVTPEATGGQIAHRRAPFIAHSQAEIVP